MKDFWSKTHKTVALPPTPFQWNPPPHFFLVGSCFAENLGVSLREAFFPTFSNPTGVVYNPVSIAKTLDLVLDGEKWDFEGLFEGEGFWRHPDFSSRLARADRTETEKSIRKTLEEASSFLRHADLVVLTFGTAAVWEEVETGRVWANCHKLPAERFRRRLLDLDESSIRLSATLERLFAAQPNLKVVMTLSPVRYQRPDIAENSLSKAVLRLLCDRMKTLFPENVDYFASSEIVLDELRDYRWYADDLEHPSTAAVAYIAERFLKHYCAPELDVYWSEAESLRRVLGHRSADQSLDQRGSAMKNEAIRRFRERWPAADVPSGDLQ